MHVYDPESSGLVPKLFPQLQTSLIIKQRNEEEPMKPTFDIRKSFEFVIKKKRDFTGVEVIKMPVKFPVTLKGGDGNGDRAIIPSDSISEENDQSLDRMQSSNVFTMRNTRQKSYDSAFPTGMNENAELQVKGMGSKSR